MSTRALGCKNATGSVMIGCRVVQVKSPSLLSTTCCSLNVAACPVCCFLLPCSPAGVVDSSAADAAGDASRTADAVSNALTHSIASLTPPSPAAAAAADAAATVEAPILAVPDSAAAAAAAAAATAAAGVVTPAGHTTVTPPGLSPLSHSRVGSDRCLSMTDDEWHMVSRGSSVKAASSSGRYSFEADPEAVAAAAAAAGRSATATPRGVSAAPSTGVTTPMGATAGSGGILSGAVSPFEGGMTDPGSECGSDVTPRDELAASILGHPVMLAAAAAAAAEDAEGSSSSSPLRPASPAAADGIAAEAAAGSSDATAAAAVSPGDTADEAVCEAEEALGLLSGGLLSLAGDLRAWIVESLAALVQVGVRCEVVGVGWVLDLNGSWGGVRGGGRPLSLAGDLQAWIAVTGSSCAGESYDRRAVAWSCDGGVWVGNAECGVACWHSM